MATLLLLGALMLPALPPAPSEDPTVLMTEDIPVFGDRRFGPALTERGFAVARAMGATALRLHTGRDASFTWERLDGFVFDATRRGFEPYLTLTYRHRYPRGPDPGWLGVPRPGEFAAFCRQAATRYRGAVRRYGIFNEPNYFDGMTPEVYNRLYRACRAAIRSVDPSAQTIYGEIAAGESASDPCDWVGRSLPPGAPTVADGIAIHTYQWTEPPELPVDGDACRGIGRLGDWTAATRTWARQRRLRTPTGDPVPILVTEHGYCAAHGECPASDSGLGNRLGDAIRADWAARAFAQARRHDVRAFSYYHLFEQLDDVRRWDSGIVGLDGSPSPVVGALRGAVERR